MPLFNEILVKTDRSFKAFDENYADALRDAIKCIREGFNEVEIYQDGELLHTVDELLLAEKELEEYFTDEDLVEEVHYAVRKLEGNNAAWAS